jgi:DNA-binding transcriptional LysR family regulator
MTLTATGAVLYQDGAKALTAIDDVVAATRQTAATAGVHLRVGYYGGASVWAKLLAPALEKLGNKYRHATTKVSELPGRPMVAELQAGRLDVAVLSPGDYGEVPGVVIEVACTIPAMVMMPANHRLAKRRQIALEDLRDEEIIALTAETAPGRDRPFIAACRAAGFSPNINNVASNLLDGIMTMKKRMGVAIIGSFAMKEPLPGIIFVKLKPPAISMDVLVAHQRASAEARCLAGLIAVEARRAALHA